MPTATRLGRELEQKRLELAQFINTRTTRDGLNFQGDDLKSFNDRNGEITRLHDEWMKSRTVEEAAQQNNLALKALQTVNRVGLYDGLYGAAATKSIGQYFVESADYRANRSNARAEFGVDVPEISLKALTTGNVPPFPLQQPGAVPYAVRRPVVADLIPQTDTEQPSVVYLEQTTQTFSAAPVAEGALKPESDLAWTRRTYPLEVLGHWIKITNQTLEDVAGIRDTIDQQLTLGLLLAEEVQLLTGDGEAPNLQGFLTKTGVQTQAVGEDDQYTAVMKGHTKVRYTGFADVTGGVMHPNDVQEIVTLKDTTGRFIYGDPTAAIANFRLWGVPTVVTSAITEGTALYGDFMMHSRIFRKGAVRVLVGLVDDDLKRNQQTLVVEERVALQIARPSAFVKVTGL